MAPIIVLPAAQTRHRDRFEFFDLQSGPQSRLNPEQDGELFAPIEHMGEYMSRRTM